ncbi:MAG: hypothetical protein GY805_27290, partial [Chloroflexi bacterium]|nr:hypothetical protein [Chloroflexota bacterium]
RFLFYIQSHDLLTFGAALLILLGLFALIFSLRVPAWRRPGWVWGSLLLSAVGYALFSIQAQSTILSGLLTTFPLILFALAYLDKSDDAPATRPIYLLALLTAVTFIGLMLIAWPAYGGKQWGARYLLPAYPPLLFAAFYGYTQRQQRLERPYVQTLRIMFIVLLGMGFVMQALGARLIFNSRAEQVPFRDSVTAVPADLILVNDPFFPSAMSSTDKMFMYVDGEQDLQTLIPRMAQADIRRFALMTAEGTPLIMPEQVDQIVVKQISAVIYEIEPGGP